jgi:eukaryotic-like serine/threonine-protein kinase
MDTDRNLLFGVLALQADFLDPRQFAEACSAWAGRKDTPLADLLVQRGWLTAEDRAHVEYLLRRKVQRHGGDAHASLLQAAATPDVRSVLESIADPDVCRSLAELPPAGPALVSTVAYRPGSRQRYTLTRLHAQGGIGQVWLAHDEDLGRDVALKELRPDRGDSPLATARFLEEARITGQLEHPGIVPVYELVQPRDGRPCYAMRFVGGRTLAEAIREYHRRRAAGEAGPLDLRELLTAFVGVCNAVAYAHSRGVLHRDLKPQNVALGDFGEVLVLDWGLAKVVGRAEEPTSLLPVALGPAEGSDRTQQGQVIGTPAYMAPEQAEGRLDRVDRRSDVYGLGAILYEILAGRPPFAGADAAEVSRRVVQEPPVPPRVFVAATPLALEAVCLRALAKKPADRYGSAPELASEIRHYLADEPVTVYRDPLLARAGRWARRRRTLVAGLVAAVLVAIVSLTVATVLLSAANRRESEARQLAQQRGEEAEQASAKARANFQLARDAVEEYGTKVSDDPRLKEKDLEELRKELLQSAVQFHQQFVAQHANDPTLRSDLGRAYFDLGKLLGFVDQLSRAIAVARQAVAVYVQLAAEHPEESSYPLKLAQALDSLGALLDYNAQTTDAQTAFSRALSTLEARRGQPADALLAWRTYLHVCTHLGDLLIYKGGAQGDGIAAYRKAVAYLEGEDPGATLEPLDVVLQAQTYAQLGSTLIGAGQPKEGQAWCARSVQTLETLIVKEQPPAALLYNLANVYNRIGRAHRGLADWPKAIAAFQKAVDFESQLVAAHPNVSKYQMGLGVVYNDLASAQLQGGQRADGYRNFHKAVEVKESLVARYPDVPDYQANLVRSLANLSTQTTDLEQARTYQHRAEVLARELNRLHPGVAQYQTALASSFEAEADLHQRANEVLKAIAAQDEAIDVWEKLVQTTDVALHRTELAKAYLDKAKLAAQAGKPELAADAFRKATALRPTDPVLFYEFGTALMKANRLEDATPILSRCVAMKPDYAEAQCDLGQCLVRQGRFVEGRAALQRGDELGSKHPGWRYQSLQWLQNADKLIQLDGRLAAILEGKAQPADSDEELALAVLCQQYKRLYTTAARFYAGAFAANPKLAEDPQAATRYNAACAAALAAAGQGEDARQQPDRVVVMLRRRALRWLQDDLTLNAKLAEPDETAARQLARQRLAGWQQDTDFASVRDKEALDKLPEDERKEWRQLWEEVAALLKKVEEKK